ncbi:hypothetical protein PUR71_36740 [Streptomyces sp. SP17BM10]|uniref:hypothetical protein n=1 Tax=Streptomyces sp. SP17BM10 TaxID=3002530 RepID=UPI002E7847A6|nr:hypothetical protein [Streptomyces sp. SP17BM10]MEE1788408.1 hypothetical protein [Streptomyces sp. SP17BM10]
MIEITGVQAEPGGSVTLTFEDKRFTVAPEETGWDWRGIFLAGFGIFMLLALVSLFGFGYLISKAHLAKLETANAVFFFSCFGLSLLSGALSWLSEQIIDFFGSGNPTTYTLAVERIAGIQYEQTDPQGGLRATVRTADGDVVRLGAAGAKGPELYRAFDRMFRPAAPQDAAAPQYGVR